MALFRYRLYRNRRCGMKKVAIAMAAVMALLSVAGCAQTGKGKAPPPVVTKG
jgi:hypothetical protein